MTDIESLQSLYYSGMDWVGINYSSTCELESVQYIFGISLSSLLGGKINHAYNFS